MASRGSLKGKEHFQTFTMTTADYDLTLKAKKYPDLTYNYICTNQAKRSVTLCSWLQREKGNSF